MGAKALAVRYRKKAFTERQTKDSVGQKTGHINIFERQRRIRGKTVASKTGRRFSRRNVCGGRQNGWKMQAADDAEVPLVEVTNALFHF